MILFNDGYYKIVVNAELKHLELWRNQETRPYIYESIRFPDNLPRLVRTAVHGKPGGAGYLSFLKTKLWFNYGCYLYDQGARDQLLKEIIGAM